MALTADFLIKLVTAPILVGGASAAGRRWGPGISGWLLSLPLISGPVIAFLAIEHGLDFAAKAAIGGMLGLISFALYCLCYSYLCLRTGWPLSALLSVVAFCLPAFLLRHSSPPVLRLFICVVCFLLLVLLLFPAGARDKKVPPPPNWEVPARVLTATASLLLITSAANRLGPRISGLLTSFPAITTVFAVFTQKFYGPHSTIRLLRGVVFGMFTLAAFFLVIALTIQRMGGVAAYASAIAIALGTHFISLKFLRFDNQGK